MMVKIGESLVDPLSLDSVFDACSENIGAMIERIPAEDHAEHLGNVTKVQFAFITFLRAHIHDREASGVFDDRLARFLSSCEEVLGLTPKNEEIEPGIIVPGA
jgi:hypothetical protein